MFTFESTVKTTYISAIETSDDATFKSTKQMPDIAAFSPAVKATYRATNEATKFTTL